MQLKPRRRYISYFWLLLLRCLGQWLLWESIPLTTTHVAFSCSWPICCLDFVVVIWVPWFIMFYIKPRLWERRDTIIELFLAPDLEWYDAEISSPEHPWGPVINWMFVLPPNSYIKILTLIAMILRGGAFGG